MMRVLIVDDKPENLYLLRALLQGHSYAVDEAYNGAEALTRARQAPPDLIISDLLMPVMDGYTLLRQWKADERLQRIPFVVYTATYTDPKDERLALDLGADAFIIKPLEPELFVNRIEEVLAKKARGELLPSADTQGDEVGLLKEYSEVLIRKLEKKVLQLEQVNRALREDIALRQQTEAELREARQEWQDIFQAIGHPTIIMDVEHGIVAANKAAVEASGKSLNEMLNTKCYELFHKSDEPPQRCPMEALLGSRSTETVEMEMEALGGYYLVSCTPVWGEEGKIRKIIHVATDITARKKSEELLRQSEETHRSLIEHLPQGIFLKDRDSVYVSCNTNYAANLGTVPEEIVGKDDFAFHPAELAELYRADDQACMATGTVKDVEEPYHLAGQERWAHTIKVPYRDGQGRVCGVLGIFEDITEHKNLEKQLFQAQKMEAIGTLAGGVSHDFNNILQVVIGYSELILGYEDLPTRHRADLQKINESARRGADLVQRLLIFSRKGESNPRPLDLNRRINEMRKMVDRTIPKMISIKLSLAEDLAAIHADPTQVDQILMNLAVNARDAMPDGGKLVIETANITLDEEHARMYLDTKPGRYVLLTVTDTGLGMDKVTLEHIFEPFYTTKGAGEGTGLGLAMVHGIVQRHGGHIRCYSEPGHGTTFKIYFPALISEEEEEEATVREMPRGGSETILLVDDEELIRDLGSKILTKAGYQVVMASNGKEALEIYQAHRTEIALVLLDLIMPQMGGKQCLESLLRINPAVNVVIASGYSANHPTRDALAAGAKGFVNKPYDVRQVLGVIRSVLDEEQRETEAPD